MAKQLTAVAVKNAGDGTLRDGGGLMLIKTGETGKWIYRYSHLKRRREMGLGQWPTISLADARRARDEWAVTLAQGKDPIAERNAEKRQAMEAQAKKDPTFAELTETVFEAMKATLRGDGTRGRWMSPLVKHILPQIGQRPVSEIDRFLIAEALKPIWKGKHPTAIKAWQRIRIVLREGKLMGYDCDPFNADAAQRILGEVRHVTVSIESTPWEKIPDLYARLGTGPVADCLRFMILTLVRMDGCAGARIEEFSDDVWTVPADRVKGTEKRVRDFRVPLSAEAQALVERIKPYAENGYLFATWRGRPATSTGLEKRLNALDEPGRPHGFRTSFRTWVQDTEACSWDVSETVLGHVVGNKVERTYARSDLLERRRPVMEAWARHVTGAATNVVQIGPRRANGEERA